MHRTNIYLDDRQTEQLDRIARHEGVSRAEVIRRMVDAGLSTASATLEADIAAIDATFGALRGSDFDPVDRKPGERERHLERIWQLGR